MNFDGIPEALKKINQWVIWFNDTTYVERGKKLPRHPRGDYTAGANNPDHWMDFTTACEKFKTRKNVSGIGLYLTKNIGMTVIDIDVCVDTNRVVDDFAQGILDKFNNQTYVELSYHKDGLHLVTYGNLPNGDVGGHRGRIEMYDCGRFIAFTGHKVTTANAHIGHCEGTLAQLCEEFPEVKETRSSKPRNGIMMNSGTIGDKLNLRCMDIAPPYKSHMEGDECVGSNPIAEHANTSGTAYNVNDRKNTWHCWAHGGEKGVGGDALMLYAMEKGFISCGEKISDWAEVFTELKSDGYDLTGIEKPIFQDRENIRELLEGLGVF